VEAQRTQLTLARWPRATRALGTPARDTALAVNASKPPLPPILAAGLRALDALVFSSLWVALAALALAAASSRALGLGASPPVLGLAFCGTVVVYTVDRLRDQRRDRLTAPLRTAFIERHGPSLWVLLGLALLGAVIFGLDAGPPVLAVAAGVAAFGFFHRRLKGWLWAKPAYLSLSWVAVTVGMPLAAAGGAASGLRVGSVVGLTVLANVVLCNLKDHEGGTALLGQRRALALAGAILAPALLLAVEGPARVQPLVCLPLLMAPVVAAFRPSERYSGLVVDGALTAGALAALALMGLGPAA